MTIKSKDIKTTLIFKTNQAGSKLQIFLFNVELLKCMSLIDNL